MKIAVVGSKGIPATWGGIERHVEELSTRFVKRGHEVTVYCRPYYTTTKDKFYKGVRLKRVPTLKTRSLDAITNSFVSTLHAMAGSYDIIHYHALGPSALCGVPRIVGKRTVATVHGLDWEREKWGAFAKQFLKFGERAAVRHPNATIVVSKFLRKYLIDKHRRDVAYIPNAVTDPVFRQPDKITTSYGLKGGDYILFVARLVPEKGCHFLLEAFKDVKTDKKLVIAGGSSHSDDYVKSLESMAGDNVIFTGYVYGEELQELYSNAYCYVLPSTIEGLPFTLLEAMSYGRCSIVSDIPPNIEVVRDNGIVFATKNVNDLKRALQQAIDDPNMVEDLGQRSQAIRDEEYSYDSIVEKTLKLYDTIVAGKSVTETGSASSCEQTPDQEPADH